MLSRRSNMSLLEFIEICYLNKYLKWYLIITYNSFKENREYNSSIHEKHHVVPDSFGGVNDLSNLAILTFKEHYICHLLLTKFIKKSEYKRKMTFSLHTFFHFDNNRKLNIKRSAIYENHKKLYVQALKDRGATNLNETIYKFKNRKTLEEFTGRSSDFVKAFDLTPQEVQFLLSRLREKNNFKHIKEWGIYLDDLEKYSYELAYPKRTHPTTTCEFCYKEMTKFNYKRWHGDNCKLSSV